MIEPKNTEENKTPQQDGSPVENKDQTQVGDTTQNNVEAEEQVTISKEELESIRKKATDFDGIIEKRRLEKLSKKPETKDEVKVNDDSIESAREAARQEAVQIIQQSQAPIYDANLREAYRTFISENSWADSDTVISAINDKFKGNGSISKEDLLTQLNIAAQNAYPKEYQQSLIEKARAEVMAQESNINAGDGGTSSAQRNIKDTKQQPTAKDIEQANKFFGGDIERYMKYKVKDNK